MIHIDTKFHVPISSTPFVTCIDIKRKTKYIIHGATILLVYILKKINKSSIFFNICYHASYECSKLASLLTLSPHMFMCQPCDYHCAKLGNGKLISLFVPHEEGNESKKGKHVNKYLITSSLTN